MGIKLYKIMYFLDYGNSYGGAANTILQQAILMKKCGNNVIITFSNYIRKNICSKFLTMCDENAIEVINLTYPISTQPEDLDIISIFDNYRIVKHSIEIFSPDIMHSIQINPIVELVSRELNIPHIMNIYPAINAFFTLKYLNIFPYYHICDSQYYANIWSKYLHTKSCCIRNIATNKIKKSFTEKDVISFICVGSIYKGKNQLSVIKGFHKVLKEGISAKLSIFGDCSSDYARDCEFYIKNNNLGENIFIKGYCCNMSEEYINHDVLICGSRRESFPNVITEAMSLGLVVIATPIAGIPEIIIDENNGYLCDGVEEDDIFRKIMQMYEDRKCHKLDSIINNSISTCESEFSQIKIAVELYNYYNKVINEFTVSNEILVEDLYDKLKTLLEKFNLNYSLLYRPEKVKMKLWYLYHVEKILIEKCTIKANKVYIWGTGEYGKIVKKMLDIFFPEIEIESFIDSYKSGEFLNYSILKYSEIQHNVNSVFLIAVFKDQDEIVNLLENSGKFCNRDYFILATRNW